MSFLIRVNPFACIYSGITWFYADRLSGTFIQVARRTTLMSCRPWNEPVGQFYNWTSCRGHS
jgi:hypothetical protein